MNRKLLPVVLVAVMVVSAWAWYAFGATPEVQRVTLYGSIVINGSGHFVIDGSANPAGGGTKCRGSKRHAVLREDQHLAISSGDQHIGDAALSPGTVTVAGGCQFTFEAMIANVETYQFRIGDLPVITRSRPEAIVPFGEGLQLDDPLTWD